MSDFEDFCKKNESILNYLKDIKMINQLKLKIKQQCDIRKNLQLRLNLASKNCEPDCYYSCLWFQAYVNMTPTELLAERLRLIFAIRDINTDIEILGKSVLIFRGKKWSF